MKRSFLFSSLFFCYCIVVAQETSKDTIELFPIEVRALRANATAPFAKTNIGKTAIQNQNLGQDLPFLLNQTPSVVISSDAGNGIGYTGIRIRGSDASRVNVTLNGVPFNDAESGGTFFVDLPDFLSSVNSIQIQRGVGTSSNGGGAFGASINLSTNEINKTPFAEFNNSYGSYNTLKNTIKVGSGLLGNHFTADLRLSRIASDGYVDRASSDLKSFYASSAYLSDRTNFRINVFSGKEKTYQAWYGISEEVLNTNRRTNSAGTEKPGEPYSNETDNYQQDHYQFFFDQQLHPNLIFNTGIFYVKGRGYYEQYKANEKYADYGISNPVYGAAAVTTTDLIRQLWLTNNFYGNLFSLQHKTGSRQLTFGGSVSTYNGDHFGEVIWAQNGIPAEKMRWYDNDAKKTEANFFGKWQQKITPRIELYTDFQWRGVRHMINGFRYNPDLKINEKFDFINPKIGISYIQNNIQAFASYSIGGKEPNRDDFEAGELQMPKAERLHDLETGVEIKENNYSLGAVFYYMKYKDQLVLTGKINDVGAYTRTNIENSYRAGIELEGALSLNKYLKASANFTFSRNRIKDFIEFIDDYDNGDQKNNFYEESDISFSPSLVGAATISLIPIKNISVDLISKYVGKQYLDNTSNEARKLDSYFTQDMRAAYHFQKKVLKNATLILQINNIFNSLYEPNGYTFSYFYDNALTTENYYYPMAGTHWMVGMNIKL